MTDHPFFNRVEQMDNIIEAKPGTLTLVVGVGGTGKTTLLRKVQEKIEHSATKNQAVEPQFLIIDLAGYDKEQKAAQNAHRFLSDLAEGLQLGDPIKRQLNETTTLDENYLAEMAGKIQLLISTFNRDNFWVVVDTTETLQEATGFWRWLEEYVVSPLLMDERCRLVFSGRVPVPWRNAEVRRSLCMMHLSALDTNSYALELAYAILQPLSKEPHLSQNDLENAARRVGQYASGNPQLTRTLAEYVHDHWEQIDSPDFDQQMCRDRVQPFIISEFFEGVQENLGRDWITILWAACVLDWFDTNILSRHVAHALPELSQQFSDKPFFFIQGVNDLRLQYSVIWRDDTGEDHLHDVIGKIMRACLKTLDPEQYEMLNQAAGKTFLEMAEQFPPEDPDAVRYREEAQRYFSPAVKERV